MEYSIGQGAVQVETSEQVVLLRWRENFDCMSAGVANRQFTDVLKESGSRCVILDFSSIDELGRWTVPVLTRLYVQAARQPKKWAVCGVSMNAYLELEARHMQDRWFICQDIADAYESLGID